METNASGERVNETVAVNYCDHYADGKAAQVWGQQTRTEQFRHWLIGLLRTNDCHTVLDTACGTGLVSSIKLIMSINQYIV